MTLLPLLLSFAANGATVRDAFPPPAGAERVAAGEFGRWLADLPLRDASEPVRTYAGDVVGHHARVVDLPLVPGDLQQCADSLIRLRATWLRETGRPVRFHATSGDALPWSRYAAGEHAVAQGNGLAWVAGRVGWEGYLRAVFTWAGTASLERYDTVPDAVPEPGDVLVQGGFPGHAVILLDVARRGDEVLVLVGEGYMPAQDFHVEIGPVDGWWRWDDGVSLPHWPLPASALRAWREPSG